MASIRTLFIPAIFLLMGFALWLTTLILGIRAKKINKKLKCQDCEKEVGKNKTCPHCGNPLIKRAKTKLWFSLHFISEIICIAIVLLFAIFVLKIDILAPFRNQENGYNEEVSQVQIDVDYINIRKEKSTNSEILGKVRKNEWYDIISEERESKYNWIEIETKKGVRGYIAGSFNDEVYVLKRYTKDFPEQNDNDTLEDINTNSMTTDQNLSPREKLHNALLDSYYRTYDNNIYSYDFSPKDGLMMRQFFLNEGYYNEVSDYMGMQMLSKYDYRNNIVTFTFKWSSYWATINWNLNTTYWNCDSSVNSWCDNNGEKYVEGEMNDTYNEVMEMFDKAGITREEALQ